jgi:hypothetical protein
VWKAGYNGFMYVRGSFLLGNTSMSASWCSALVWLVPIGAKGCAGCGFLRASISSVAARNTLSADDSRGNGTVADKNSTVSAIQMELVDGM